VINMGIDVAGPGANELVLAIVNTAEVGPCSLTGCEPFNCAETSRWGCVGVAPPTIVDESRGLDMSGERQANGDE